MASTEERDPHAPGWKLGGLIYWDKNDPDIFISRKYGVTINLGRPIAWVVSIFIILALVGPTFLLLALIHQ